MIDFVSRRRRFRYGEPPRIIRPHINEDESGVQLWLLRHPDEGWRGVSEQGRRDAARHLLFVVWLRKRGEVTDG